MYIWKDLNYSWMIYPRINKPAHCLQALATLWRAPQWSIHTAHFWPASFFCFPLSPFAFPPPKNTSFYGNKTHHQNGQNSVMSPRAGQKQGLNELFAVSARSQGRRGAMSPHVCTHVWAWAAGPAHTRCPLVTRGTHMHSHRLPGTAEGSAELTPSHSALI